MINEPFSPCLGEWRIVELVAVGKAVDLPVCGRLELRAEGMGEFDCPPLRGWIDHRLLRREGQPAVEWSWEGSDGPYRICGRGWAVLRGPDLLSGRLFIHEGDEMRFTAHRCRSPQRFVANMSWRSPSDPSVS